MRRSDDEDAKTRLGSDAPGYGGDAPPGHRASPRRLRLGSEGEGEWRATLTGPGEPFGSAVLLVTGEGIQDVTGDAGVRVWIQETDPGEFRAVLVQTEATGSVHFRIRVQDMAAPPPSVAVLEAADLADEQVQVTEAHRVRLQR